MTTTLLHLVVVKIKHVIVEVLSVVVRWGGNQGVTEHERYQEEDYVAIQIEPSISLVVYLFHFPTCFIKYEQRPNTFRIR